MTSIANWRDPRDAPFHSHIRRDAGAQNTQNLENAVADSEDPAVAWSSVYCHRAYNPVWVMGQRNPAFSKATDGRLLDLKDNLDHGVKNAAADFRTVLAKLSLPAGTILMLVPGHEAASSNAGSGLARVLAELASNDSRFVASPDSLIRTKTVDKKAKGGERSVQGHLQSIKVRQPPDVKGATVVILDDTVTTGNSIEAARQLLVAAGAKAVAGIGLGRTVKYL